MFTSDIVIGLETQCGVLSRITFCDEAGAFHETIDKLMEEFGDVNAYGGIAVHNYDDDWWSLIRE